MFNEKTDGGLAENNEEEYMRHFGFTVEDLSFLISPQSSLSPIKKKQRNVFNFDAYQSDDTSPPTSARDPPAPGPYPGNFQTVYEPPERTIKEEPIDEGLTLPSFDGLDLSCFEDNNTNSGPLSSSTAGATVGSAASTIGTDALPPQEDLRQNFVRQGSSAMTLGSLAFSAMSSFNFDENEQDELSGLKASGTVSNILNMNIGGSESANLQINSSATGRNIYDCNSNNRTQRAHPSVPPLPFLSAMTGGAPPNMICIEDASFIINAQQQQLNQQQHLLEKQQRALAQAQWLDQQNGSSTHSTPRSPPAAVSRIGSFKSTLPPLSVDLNALNAAHQAHHEAKMFSYPQNSGGAHNTSNHSMNSSSGTTAPVMSARSNLSSQASSPEHTIKKTPRDERLLSDGSMSGMATAAALAVTGTGKEDTRASKSLATISRRFVEHFGDANTFEYISGQLDVDDVHDGPAVMNRVDGAAEVLGVHVRRIYELIKILEILSLVAFTGDKRGKFSWRGTKDFLMTLGAIQADGIFKYPDIAYANGVRLTGSLKPPLSVYPHRQQHSGGDGSGHSSTVSTPMDGHTGGMLSPGTVTSTTSGGSGVSRVAAEAHLESIAECDTISSDTFDRNSLSVGGRYEHNSNESDTLELHLDGLSDFHDHAPHLQSDADKTDLDGSELDAFVQLMASDAAAVDDMHMSESTVAASGQPKQGKKRTAIKKSSKTTSSSGGNTSSGSNEEFMVEGICKSFLQLFLVGMDGLSMNFAIQRLIPMDAGQALSEYNKQNATKIRRVYDVANVLCSLSLINKIPQSQRRKSESITSQGNYNSNGGNSSSINSNNLHRDGGGSSSTPQSSCNKGMQAAAGKADAKILEWGSFAPATIREYYINKTTHC